MKLLKNLAILMAFGLLLTNLHGQEMNEIFETFTYRNFAPHRVGSWISDIAVPESDDPKYDYTFYVAGRHGGVWKTVNNGITFEAVFEDYGNLSIGAIEVSRSNPEVIWVGTGEASCARSAHAGNGIYKSVNGGKDFECMGLEDSHHIPRIVISPLDENTVYVAVMGHLYSPNEQRGVFKTSDGGRTWEKMLYIDENTGVIDLVMNPENTDILYAATYDKARYPWHYEAGGSESGIYKTSNGGESWERLSGGLPGGNIGRIGIDIYRADPDILYTVIENLNPKAKPVDEGPAEFDRSRDPYFDRFVGGEVYRTGDAGGQWTKMNHDTVDVSSKAAYSFNQIMIDPNDERNLFINNVWLQTSHDRGITWYDWTWRTHLFTDMFGDIRTFWIDPDDSRHLIVGSDGGVYITYDGGRNMQHLYHLPMGEMYTIEVDMEVPYNIYAGLQDHEGWKAPSNSFQWAICPGDWQLVGFSDGMYTQADPVDGRWLYTTSQFGSHFRVDQSTGERESIVPKAPEGEPPYRFTWNTPLVISPHDPATLYAGAQKLLRTTDRGETWEELSDDLTSNDSVKIAGKGHIMYCTITTISESPVKPGVIWVGTDDGRVYMTPDSGNTWKDFTGAIEKEGVPEERWVSRVFASHHDEAVAYVTKSGYRNDDFKPYVFITRDRGKTWEDIGSILPDQPVSVIWEDDTNPDLLFIGNDHGVYLSLNRGKQWVRFNQNIPPVPVKDLKVHSRDRDLVLATYGRGAWVTDIYPFLEITPGLLEKQVHLFRPEPKPQLNCSQQARWGNRSLQGSSHLFTPNERNGITIYYYLKDSTATGPAFLIRDQQGDTLQQLAGSGRAGINRVQWNTWRAEPGSYRVTMETDAGSFSTEAIVKKRWLWEVGNTNARQPERTSRATIGEHDKHPTR